ncbi:MAG: hypothetical protein IJD93_06505 [Ruminococcus sp.]|nr:hypothetical protein [Ruminococcus sp.]
MKTKTFNIILIALVSLCLVCTVAHVVYAISAYQHCSIIHFIGEELW